MRYIVLPLLLSISTAYATADSTQVRHHHLKPAASPFLLEHGTVTSAKANGFQINQETTSKRCPSKATPILMTSISSVKDYGAAQAIEGIKNEIVLDTGDYSIHGRLSAPVNVPASDNSVTVNWQIWCHPDPEDVA